MSAHYTSYCCSSTSGKHNDAHPAAEGISVEVEGLWQDGVQLPIGLQEHNGVGALVLGAQTAALGSISIKGGLQGPHAPAKARPPIPLQTAC